MKLYTIGFTKKSAEEFFSIIKHSGVRRVIDVRLNNASQLAGFTKKEDLKYFLKQICNIEYIHMLEFAPTQDILDAYKKEGGSIDQWERSFNQLISKRHIEKIVNPKLIEGACLLCSEAAPEHCHRRLVAEYLNEKWGGLKIIHL
jgi:uncharacterized protein (DUF488 family)